MTLLVVFSGLPGVGKTAMSRPVADALGATYLRVDSIESAIATALVPVGGSPAGYLVAERVAEDQLRAGRPVVVDAVNEIELAREGWRQLAARRDAELCFVEVVCSDTDEHRRRVEARGPEMTGHVQPSWAAVTARGWEPFATERRLVDNLGDPAPHVTALLSWLADSRRGGPQSAEA